MNKVTRIENRTESKVKKKVAAYCRVSTGSDEQLVSLGAQKEHYESYIAQHPDWVFAGIYYDEGVTGTRKDKRTGLMKMLSDCEAGKIDLIITKSISRFARNTADCIEMIRALAEIDVYIYFENENIRTDDIQSELILSILAALAEQESRSTSDNVKWGVQKRFEDGTFKIGFPPYGYRNNDGVMEIVSEEAAVVKEIFDSYLSGKTTHIIARELEEKGIATRKGGTWQPSTVNGILKNEKYTGDVIFQKTYTDGSFNRHINRGEADKFIAYDHHEAIITREEFEKAQELMHRHFAEKGGVKGGSKYNKRYPFSGKIRCGECGGTFKRKIYKGKDEDSILWSCAKHIDDKDSCSMKAVRQDVIETAFCNMMNKLIAGRKEVIEPLLEALKTESHAEAYRRINTLEDALEENAGKRERLQSLLKQGLLDAEVFNDENNALLSECRDTESELIALKAETNQELTRTEEVVKLMKHLNRADKMTEFEDAAFTEYADGITVNGQKELTFNLKCGLDLTEAV